MLIARLIAMTALLGLLAACDTNNLKDPPTPMGDFAMGLNVVVDDTAQTVPISRKALPGEWKDAMTQAMVDRFGSYSGDRLFNFGISIDGYELAPPGVPIIASPKSVLIATVSVWDDATQTQFNPGGKRVVLVEGLSPESVIGSGWTQNRKQQMAKMAYKAALAVQNYLLDNPDIFGLPPRPHPTKVPNPEIVTSGK